MILGLVWMATANAAALLGSWAALRKLRTGSESLDVLLFLVIHAAVISTTVLLFGLAGVLHATAIGIAGTAALALLLAFGVHRTRPALSRPAASTGVLVLAALAGLRLLAQAWIFAPSLGDTLAYHLPKIGEWIQAEGLTVEHGLNIRTSFPAGFELVETWWVVFLRHDVLIELGGIQFLVMAASAVYALARQLGWAQRTASFAALLYSLTPTLHFQATACINDGAIAALILATAALVFGRVHPLVLLLPMGMAMGIKGSFLYAFPGLFLLAVLVRKGPPAPDVARRWAAGAAVVGILLGTYWYARNQVLHGNPVHPVGNETLQHLEGRYVFQRGPRIESLVLNTRALFDRGFSDEKSAYGQYGTRGSGWGAVVFSCGLAALILLLRSEPGLRRLAAAFLLSLGCVLLLVFPDPWALRFVLFFPALPCLAAARLGERFRGATLVAAAGAGLMFIGTFVPAEYKVGQVADLVAQPWHSRTANGLPLPPEYRDDAAIGCFGRPNKRAYWLYLPDFSRRVVYFRSESTKALVSDMKRHGIRILYASDSDPLIREGLEAGTFRPLPGDYVALRED